MLSAARVDSGSAERCEASTNINHCGYELAAAVDVGGVQSTPGTHSLGLVQLEKSTHNGLCRLGPLWQSNH